MKPLEIVGLFLSVAVIVCGVVLPLSYCFQTIDCKVVLENPTEAQLLKLYEASSDANRFWIYDMHSVKGEHSLVEAVLQVRGSEFYKVPQTLERLGIDYEIVGKGSIWGNSHKYSSG